MQKIKFLLGGWAAIFACSSLYAETVPLQRASASLPIVPARAVPHETANTISPSVLTSSSVVEVPKPPLTVRKLSPVTKAIPIPIVPPNVADAMTPSPAPLPTGWDLPNVAEDIARMQTELALTRAKIALLTEQQNLRKLSDVAGDTAVPTVKSVFGRGKSLFASVILETGDKMSVAPGDLLPGGYKVLRINAHQVTFAKDGRRYSAGLTTGSSVTLANGNQ